MGVPVVPLVQRKIPPPSAPPVNGERSKAVIPNEGAAPPFPAAVASSGRPAPPVTTGRPRDADHPGDVRVGCTRVKRDNDPAGRDERYQGGGIAERVGEPDDDPGATRQARLVQAALRFADDAEQASVGQRGLAAGIREVDVIAMPGGGHLDPAAYHRTLFILATTNS